MNCNHAIEVWGPHEGCREFMDEPEAVYECGRPAISVTVLKEFFPPDISVPEECRIDNQISVIWSCLDCSPPTSATPYCEIIYPKETT